MDLCPHRVWHHIWSEAPWVPGELRRHDRHALFPRADGWALYTLLASRTRLLRRQSTGNCAQSSGDGHSFNYRLSTHVCTLLYQVLYATAACNRVYYRRHCGYPVLFLITRSRQGDYRECVLLLIAFFGSLNVHSPPLTRSMISFTDAKLGGAPIYA